MNDLLSPDDEFPNAVWLTWIETMTVNEDRLSGAVTSVSATPEVAVENLKAQYEKMFPDIIEWTEPHWEKPRVLTLSCVREWTIAGETQQETHFFTITGWPIDKGAVAAV